jgi:hypothetical protein
MHAEIGCKSVLLVGQVRIPAAAAGTECETRDGDDDKSGENFKFNRCSTDGGDDDDDDDDDDVDDE